MPRHPLNTLTTLDRSHCQCSSSSCRFRQETNNRPGYLLQPSLLNNAIDVFDRLAFLELRRAARLQPVFKTSFSRLNPVPRGQATVIRSPSRYSPKTVNNTRKPLTQFTLATQSDKLPSYLRPLLRFQPARPSTISSGPGSDASNNLTVAQNTWKPPDQSSLHNVCRTRNQHKGRCKTFISSEDNMPSVSTPIDLVELSGIEPLTPCLQSRCSPS